MDLDKDLSCLYVIHPIIQYWKRNQRVQRMMYFILFTRHPDCLHLRQRSLECTWLLAGLGLSQGLVGSSRVTPESKSSKGQRRVCPENKGQRPEGLLPLELAGPARTGLLCLWERMGPENWTDQTCSFTASSKVWVLFVCYYC